MHLDISLICVLFVILKVHVLSLFTIAGKNKHCVEVILTVSSVGLYMYLFLEADSGLHRMEA